MAYKRKTVDEIQIHVKYEGKWEHDCNATDYKEAKQNVKDYNNEGYSAKIVVKRVKPEVESND